MGCQFWVFLRKLATYKPVTLYVKPFSGHHYQTIASEIHLILWTTLYCLSNSFLNLDFFKFLNRYVIRYQNSDKFSGNKIENLLLYVYFKPQKPQSFNAIPLLIREATLTSDKQNEKSTLLIEHYRNSSFWSSDSMLAIERSRFAGYHKEPLSTCQLSRLFQYLNSRRPSDASIVGLCQHWLRQWLAVWKHPTHYNDVIMGTIAS